MRPNSQFVDLFPNPTGRMIDRLQWRAAAQQRLNVLRRGKNVLQLEDACQAYEYLSNGQSGRMILKMTA
jgi:hypothetical protein